MTISREKCLEMADRLAKECTSGDEFLEALINRAYAEGQKDMREQAAKLCDTEASIVGEMLAEEVRELEIK